MTAVPDQQGGGGFFAFLDDIGTTVQNSAKDLLGAVAQREVDRIRTGSESKVTSEGDPNDNPQNVTNSQALPFYQQYKTELMIGGAVVGGLLVLLIATRD